MTDRRIVPGVVSDAGIARRSGGRKTRWDRLRHEWHHRLDPSEQSAVISWAAFRATFGSVRVLTHWIRAGHGPAGGGISLGGRHFHRYNIGIALLGAVERLGRPRSRRTGVTRRWRSPTARAAP